MKKLIFIITLLFHNLPQAQILTGVVKDSISKEILQLANITFLKSNLGTNTNLEGLYFLNFKEHADDSIKVTYVGYQPKYYSLSRFSSKSSTELNINLVKEDKDLEEVYIFYKKINYGREKIINEKRQGDIAMFSLIGHETACYIENSENELGKLKTLKLYIRKNNNADFIAKFRIKIYTFNKNENRPEESLLKEDLIINPKNKTYQLNIDLENKKIPFPKEGICIGIEIVDENNLSKKNDRIGPGFRFTYGEKRQLTYYNYRNKGWVKNDIYDKKSNNISKLMLSLIVLMKNEK